MALLRIPFGEKRSRVVDKLNLHLLRVTLCGYRLERNVVGIGTTPVQCPSWAILALDHMGRVKQPYCIGSAEGNALKPICEECSLGCYSVLVAQGIKSTP
jgi:hypothetical protein